MKTEIFRYIKLFSGLFFCALGAITVLKSELGLPPWDVLNQGTGIVSGITIGNASILIGIIIVIIDIMLGLSIGVGTIINFIIVGIFMDFIENINMVPEVTTLVGRVIELIFGIFFYSYGTYLYMIQGMGCGPRDGLMQILIQKLHKSVTVVKNTIEIIVLLIGWYLGGTVGVGTVATAIMMGFLLEIFFKLGPVDIQDLKHRNLHEEYIHLKKVLKFK